jgi:NADH-quinone oxidoreductase subunit C
MNEILENLVTSMRERFGYHVEDVSEFRGDVVVTVSRDAIIDVVTFLRDHPDTPFPLCADVFGVDQFTRKQRFEVVYNLYSLVKKLRLFLKVRVEEDDATIPSITGLFPSAGWYERETYDMIGVQFPGHPDLRRVYMPEDFEYYPMRKDFPLMGIPGSIPLPKRG